MTPDVRSNRPFKDLGSHFMLSDNEGGAHLVMAEYEAIANQIAKDGVQTVLDWGCGFGYVADLLRQHGVDVTMFDFDPNADGTIDTELSNLSRGDRHSLERARAAALLRWSVRCGALLGEYEHVQYPEHSLQEIRRVLRPTGTFYLYKIPNRYSWVEFAARKSGAYYHGAHLHDRVYTFHSIQQMTRKAGFDIVRVSHRNFFPLHRLSRLTPPHGAKHVRRASDVLTRTPVLRALATNIELVATKT